MPIEDLTHRAWSYQLRHGKPMTYRVEGKKLIYSLGTAFQNMADRILGTRRAFQAMVPAFKAMEHSFSDLGVGLAQACNMEGREERGNAQP